MPIPAASDDGDDASIFLRLFRQVHDQIRNEIADLDDEGLNWRPWEGANSVSVVITHLVGSEAETVLCVAGLPCERNRDGEFSHARQTRAEVLARLERADLLLTDLSDLITGERLHADVALPTLPPEERRPGITWLVGNYGHSREHVGHIQLTRDLQRRSDGRSSSF